MFAIRNQIKTEDGVKYFFFGDYDKGHPLKKDIKFLLQHLKQIVVFRNIHKLYCTWHIISPTVIDFKTYLFDLIKNNKETKVVIDLSNVEFADSSFLGAIVSGLKKITAVKGDIKIIGLQSPVRAMFELTRLYKVFEIFDNKDDVLNSY